MSTVRFMNLLLGERLKVCAFIVSLGVALLWGEPVVAEGADDRSTRAQTTAKSKPKSADPVSLEAAMEITASFESTPLVAPPRTVRDITAILAEEDPQDLASYQAARKLADTNPPDTDDSEKLARFYYYRAQAAREVGRARQEIEDYRASAKYGEQSGSWYHTYALVNLTTAEAEGGNIARAIEAMEARLAKERNRDMKGAVAMGSAYLARLYAFAGDLEAAQAALTEAKRNKRLFLRYANANEVNRASKISSISAAEAAVLDTAGRFSEAEVQHRSAVATWAPHKDAPPLRWGVSELDPKLNLTIYEYRVGNLADNLRRQGHLVEAELHAREALRSALRSHGRYAAHTAVMLRKLNHVIFAQGRYAEAEVLARANIDIYTRASASADSTSMALARQLLADSMLAQGQWDEARVEYEAIRKALASEAGSYEAYIARNLNPIFALLENGQGEEALELVQPVYERKRALLGDKHYETVEAQAAFAMALYAAGDESRASAEFAEAIPILLQRSRRSEDADTSQPVVDLRRRIILEAYINLLIDTGDNENTNAGPAAEAFLLADFARAPAVQRALNASSARASARDPALAELVRSEQDAGTRIAALYGLLSNVLSDPEAGQGSEIIRDLRARIDRLRDARGALIETIEAGFPAYAQLMNPKPPSVAQVQASLRPGEALVAIFVGRNRTHVWAIPKRGAMAFTTAQMGAAEIAARVWKLRQSLDPAATTLGEIPAFDLNTAHELYAALFKPVEAGWKAARSLLVVSDGALGFLPLSLLPTEPATLGADTETLFANYQSVPWLARTHALTRLPSVSSLSTLRALPRADPARRVFVGFGDPVFNKEQLNPASLQTQVASTTTRGLLLKRSAAPDTRRADTAQLAQLPRLPHTAEELEGIAAALGADPERDIFLAEAATEASAKSGALSGVKVIAFATHGLLPGDLDGLDQPALALSSPAVTGTEGDGLLTMAEILEMRLDADWVVLSACNTGAGDGAGAEAISGLGRAFFYAGTRSLLVSNWPVETTSAKALTTDLFKRQSIDPSLRRVEALRAAMLELIDGPGYVDETGETAFSFAHPIFWAPFTLVGDGGETR